MLERPPIASRLRRRGVLAVVAPAVVAAAAVVVTAVVFRDDVAGWIAGERGVAGPGDRSVAFYTCAMDPSVESDHPGVCPICGMALTPVTRAERSSGIVHITAATRIMMGLVVEPAAIRPQSKRVVASGEVVAGGAGPDRAAIAVRVYRGDPADVQVGQPVHAAVPELPVTQFTGTVSALVPGAAPGGLAIVVDDPGHVLRPGMRAEAQLEIELLPRLVVPAQAVLYAGARRIVFVERKTGLFEPRAVKLGVTAGGLAQVIEGVSPGEPVVIQGMFLLAAESRLRSDSPLWDDRPPPAPIRRPPEPVRLPKPPPGTPLPGSASAPVPGSASAPVPGSAAPSQGAPPRPVDTAATTPTRSARP